MKSNKTMLLGIVIALIGIGLAQPGNSFLAFRTFTFISVDAFTTYFPLLSVLLIFIGAIIGIIGYFQKNQE
ncbi:hypothetical protein [Ktedonobacter robiniae]|uniref:DUF3955 domain-containing protein n=1 Tax=Ktedonobacter robiniae TaxID=2778365 RepID=A0ABQ3ULK0_9CHLR|nr:hypothetical protein [Ktedonobacter robiniae]GHO53608.1 hypothetical protein KSB_20830 [Ktedonobacter robiniae]